MATNYEKVMAEIGLDCTDFKAGMKEARDAAKAFADEEKLVDAEMKANGVTVGGLTAKYKALKGQVEAQKQKLKTLTDEYKKVCESQGENSEAAQALAADIRKENVTLSTLQSKATQANVALILLKKAAQGAKTVLIGLGEALAKGWNASLQIATDAAAKWDDVATAAARAQTSTEDYQGLVYAANFLDFDMEGYAKAKNKVLTLAQQTITDAFADAGLAFDWSDIDFGDKGEVFNALLAQLGQGDEAQRAAIEKALFGDELGVKMRTLYGEDAVQQLQQLQTEAERLGIITAEAGKVSLQSLNDAHDKFNAVKEGLFSNLGALFADNFATMFDSAAEYMGVFSKGLQIFKEAGGGAEGKAAMKEYLNGALTEVDENGETVGSRLIDGLVGTIENFGIMADIAGVLVDAISTELTTNEALQTAFASIGESLGKIWSGEDGNSGVAGMLADVGQLVVDFFNNVLWPLIQPVLVKLRAALVSMANEVGNDIMDIIDPMFMFHDRPEVREADSVIEESKTASAEFEEAQAKAAEALAAWEEFKNGGVTAGAGGGRYVVPTETGTTTTNSPETSALLAESAAILERANAVLNSGTGSENYTETDNSTHEQNVTIYVSGASSPTETGNKIAALLSDYYERNERARKGGATGNTRAHVVYD